MGWQGMAAWDLGHRGSTKMTAPLSITLAQLGPSTQQAEAAPVSLCSLHNSCPEWQAWVATGAGLSWAVLPGLRPQGLAASSVTPDARELPGVPARTLPICRCFFLSSWPDPGPSLWDTGRLLSFSASWLPATQIQWFCGEREMTGLFPPAQPQGIKACGSGRRGRSCPPPEL